MYFLILYRVGSFVGLELLLDNRNLTRVFSGQSTYLPVSLLKLFDTESFYIPIAAPTALSIINNFNSSFLHSMLDNSTLIFFEGLMDYILSNTITVKIRQLKIDPITDELCIQNASITTVLGPFFLSSQCFVARILPDGVVNFTVNVPSKYTVMHNSSSPHAIRFYSR